MTGGPLNAKSKSGRPRKMCGRRRRDTGALGRYPFLAAANKYLETRKGMIAENTWQEEERKYRYLNGVIEGLKQAGKMTTADPRAIERPDVQAFLIWMRERNLDGATQVKYLRYLSRVCLKCGNTVIEDLRLLERDNLPRAIQKDITCLDEEKLGAIQEAASQLTGWHGVVGELLVWLYPNTGVRPGELRMAHLEDLDVVKWRFYVRHPKGESKYGVKRTVPILPPARPFVLRYLAERLEHLREYGMTEHVALVPNLQSKEGFYSSKSFRKIKAKVQAKAGRSFKLKDFRPTWAQSCKDRGIEIEAVSKMMGHASTATTEKHYARIRDENAFKEFEKAWADKGVNVSAPESKNRFIDKRFEITGYQ